VTLEKLKNEDFSLLSATERKVKEEEMSRLQAAKLANTYVASLTDAAHEEEDKFNRIAETPLPAIPPHNQPPVGQYDDDDEDDADAAAAAATGGRSSSSSRKARNVIMPPTSAPPATSKAGMETRQEKEQRERDSFEYKQWGQPILDTLKSLQNESKSNISSSRSRYVYSSDKAYISHLKELHVKPADVAKVTENRITHVWIHPAEQKLLVCAGDKSGFLGVWDVDSGDSKQGEDEEEEEEEEEKKDKRKKQRRSSAAAAASASTNIPTPSTDLHPIYMYGNRYKSSSGVGGVFKYRPHVSAICRIYSAAEVRSNIHTVSYDGTGM